MPMVNVTAIGAKTEHTGAASVADRLESLASKAADASTVQAPVVAQRRRRAP